MGRGAMKITLHWSEEVSLSELKKILNNSKFINSDDKGGIYFWITSGKHQIAYIGECGNFKERFIQHLEKTLHGEYSAFKFEDNLYIYYREYDKNTENHYDKKFVWDDINGVWENPEKAAEEIIRGICMNLAYIEKMQFIFATIRCDNGQCDKKFRKRIESLLMLKLESYIREKYDKKSTIWRKNCYFFGKRENKPEDCRGQYIVSHEGNSDSRNIIAEALGIGTIDDKWRLQYDPKNGFLNMDDEIDPPPYSR
jgi:hypothetical protein